MWFFHRSKWIKVLLMIKSTRICEWSFFSWLSFQLFSLVAFFLFEIVYLNSTGFNVFFFICRDWSLYVEAWNDIQSGESHPSIDEGHDPTGAVIDVWPWWRGLMGVEMEIEIECAGFKIKKRCWYNILYIYIYIFTVIENMYTYIHILDLVFGNQSSKRSQHFIGTRCKRF